ncbi:actin [Acrasis kona]|uniref:Actin n=1 Tax=Acrasis kona TaxID=1008807 RepID=A0AAW2ZMB6_9EUKA
MTHIICDNGTYKTRVGYSGDTQPTSEILTRTGIKKDPMTSGYEFLFPIKGGIIIDHDRMETIWTHIFDELNIKPKDHSILLTEAPFTPKSNQCKTAQIMFEKFSYSGICFGIDAVFSYISNGRSTGTIVTSGAETTHVVPIYEGSAIKNAIKSLPIGGEHITRRINDIVCRGQQFISLDAARNIKENNCMVTLNYDRQMIESSEFSHFDKEYTLPDNNTIVVTREMMMLTEVMFDPSIMHHDSPGIHEMYNSCIEYCPEELRRRLTDVVLLSGGNMRFNNTCTRFQQELNRSSQSFHHCFSSPPSDESCWMGASLFSRLSYFDQCLTSFVEYEEYGDACFYRSRA